MTPILVFDIETVPDIAGLRRTHDLPAGLSDDAVLAWYTQQRRARTGSDFMPLHYQRVVALRIAQEVENATIVFIVCDRGDRYLSTGVFPA